MGKVINKIFNIAFIVLVSVCLVVIVSVGFSLKDNKVPSIFGYSFLVVQTPSMEPAIHVNDMVVVKAQDEYTYEDVITYYTTIQNIPTTITHRIIRITEVDGKKIYTTKGDNNTGEDEPISEDEIVGKVVNQSTFFGQMFSFQFLRNPKYLFPIIIVVLLGFALTQVSNIISAIKEMKKSDK